jgi:hypothetical protein
MNMNDEKHDNDVVDSNDQNEKFEMAAHMIKGLLDYIRQSEVTMFDNKQDLDFHLTHALFFSAASMYGEEFARNMLDTAEEAIDFALSLNEDENMPMQNAPMTSTLIN